MRYLTARQILLLHYRLIDVTGGSQGVRDSGRIQSAVEAPKQEVISEIQSKTVYEKVAIFIRNIIFDHPFIDGNKRTAMLCGLTFLELNGHRIDFKNGEVEKMAIKIVSKRLELEMIAVWLENNSKKIER